jgi:hypothetical protein
MFAGQQVGRTSGWLRSGKLLRNFIGLAMVERG